MRTVLSGFVSLLLLACLGCSDTHESIYAGVVQAHREINNILEGVNAESDPDHTADAIQVEVENLMDLKAQADQLAPPGPEIEAQLREKYAEPMRTERERSKKLAQTLQEQHPLVWQKVNVALNRLQSP